VFDAFVRRGSEPKQTAAANPQRQREADNAKHRDNFLAPFEDPAIVQI